MGLRKSFRSSARRVLPSRAKIFLARINTKIQTSRPPHKFSFENASNNSPQSPFPFVVNTDNILEKLGEKYLPSKRLHNYLVYYWSHFRDIRLEVKSVLEIGVETGSSIRMWEEFFPNAIIYGIDINPACKQFEGGRRRILIGDQSDPDFLLQLRQSAEPFDVIIDDGSHRIEHQLKTFELLFPTMSDHGVYVIEDTGGCVDDFGLRTVNSLKELVDNIMYWPKGNAGHWSQLSRFPDKASWISRNVIGIAFYRWIVFVMRGRNPGDNPFLIPPTSEPGISGPADQ